MRVVLHDPNLEWPLMVTDTIHCLQEFLTKATSKQILKWASKHHHTKNLPQQSVQATWHRSMAEIMQLIRRHLILRKSKSSRGLLDNTNPKEKRIKKIKIKIQL